MLDPVAVSRVRVPQRRPALGILAVVQFGVAACHLAATVLPYVVHCVGAGPAAVHRRPPHPPREIIGTTGSVLHPRGWLVILRYLVTMFGAVLTGVLRAPTASRRHQRPTAGTAPQAADRPGRDQPVAHRATGSIPLAAALPTHLRESMLSADGRVAGERLRSIGDLVGRVRAP